MQNNRIIYILYTKRCLIWYEDIINIELSYRSRHNFPGWPVTALNCPICSTSSPPFRWQVELAPWSVKYFLSISPTHPAPIFCYMRLAYRRDAFDIISVLPLFLTLSLSARSAYIPDRWKRHEHVLQTGTIFPRKYVTVVAKVLDGPLCQAGKSTFHESWQ